MFASASRFRALRLRAKQICSDRLSRRLLKLDHEGLVEEIGEGESTGGRRPTLLRLRTKEPIAVGVAITPTCTTVATSDLAGRVVEQEEFLTDSDPVKTLNRSSRWLRNCRAETRVDRGGRRESARAG